MRSIEERNELIEKHLDLAKNLAGRRFRTVHQTVQFGELLSAAYFGLIDAAKKFDAGKVNPEAGNPFEAYAKCRILGEMNDYLRSCNWGTRNNPQHLVSLEQDAYSSSSGTGRFDESSKLSDTCSSDDRPAIDVLNGEELFAKIIRSLSKRDRKVFQLYYLHGLTMKEVAGCLNLSESRVSQIISKDTDRLRLVWDGRSHYLWSEI